MPDDGLNAIQRLSASQELSRFCDEYQRTYGALNLADWLAGRLAMAIADAAEEQKNGDRK